MEAIIDLKPAFVASSASAAVAGAAVVNQQDRVEEGAVGERSGEPGGRPGEQEGEQADEPGDVEAAAVAKGPDDDADAAAAAACPLAAGPPPESEPIKQPEEEEGAEVAPAPEAPAPEAPAAEVSGVEASAAAVQTGQTLAAEEGGAAAERDEEADRIAVAAQEQAESNEAERSKLAEPAHTKLMVAKGKALAHH